MTLKITRFLTDAMNKQAKISHFGSSISVGKPDEIQTKYKSMISKQFGELFLNDANYVVVTMVKTDSPDFDKKAGKFVDLVATVLDTDIAKNEAKILNLDVEEDPGELPDDADMPDDEADTSAAAIPGKIALIMKITTK